MDGKNFKKNIELFKPFIKPFIEKLSNLQKKDEVNNYRLVGSKVDSPTLKATIEGNELFLHSKYNPIQEAERMVNNIDSSIQDKNHIIFFGVGLGYHIEQLINKYPDKEFTMIEPKKEIFVRFLESRSLHEFPINKLKGLYVQSEELTLNSFLTALATHLKGDAFVYVLPFYERTFKEDVLNFYNTYQDALKMTKSNVLAAKAFGKRWVINSLMNLPKTLKTENIFEKKLYFKGKPIIIASAGPSLEEDLKHLKHVKENGLAYIFAVGSANKALLAHNILPDAVLTYDPQPQNVNVFKELISSGHTDIPMIYGTSVGFETIDAYPGPLFYFVNSADTVTNFYLDKPINDYDIQDSTTVALIALQVAALLGAEPIILAGQNLAFKDNRFYATGIKYGNWEGEVRKDKEGRNLQKTKDVYGNEVETNESLINMRRDIENYIASNPDLVVINTTKGGAKIKGAPFEPIEKLIKNKLTKNVVDKNWCVISNNILTDKTIKQVIKMEQKINRFYDSLESCISTLDKLRIKNTSDFQQLKKLFNEFDKQFNRMLNNTVYSSFIFPVLRNDFERTIKTIRNIVKSNEFNKNEVIIAEYDNYLNKVDELFKEMVVHIQKKVHPIIMQENERVQFYFHNDGVFHYEGNWQRETIAFDDLSRTNRKRTISNTISTMSGQKGAKIKFRFEGTMLQIYAQTHPDFANHVKVTIDGMEKKLRTKDVKIKNLSSPKLHQKVLEIKALKNEIHEVHIELLSEEEFHFEGIAINDNGRVYHINEVTSIEELVVGKRIRCHVSEVDEQGNAVIESLGKMITQQMPLNSYNKSFDFYIEKVFEDKQGRSKFVSNRNLGIVVAKYAEKDIEIQLNKVPVLKSIDSTEDIQLNSGPYYETKTNKWDAYKAFNKLNGIGNCWATTRGSLTGWLEIAFKKPTMINCYTFVSQDYWPYFDSAKRMPKDWVLEAWNEDEEKWELLDVRKQINSWCVKEKKIFTFQNDKKYSRYRFNIKENNGDPDFIAIGEIELV